jgi:nifR3 family TIM-barrel protein
LFQDLFPGKTSKDLINEWTPAFAGVEPQIKIEYRSVLRVCFLLKYIIMKKGFWSKLKKPARHASQLAGVAGRPIMVLAPMANVTDTAFRCIIARNGKPDVTWTEFVSVDGLLSEGKDKLLVDLRYTEAERPIVAQIFGSKPENFEKVAKMLAEMGFDGIDINMGCPDKAVVKQGAGAGCMRDPKLAQEIIYATMRGAPNLPVSVKTRIGFNKVEIDTWIPTLLETKIAALTVHLRTMKEMSKVPAHWELMPQIVGMVKAIPEEDRPILLGNGDVMTIADAEQKVAETGCDGVMFGRAIFGNPWLFDRSKPDISISERMRAMLEHTRLFEKELGHIKRFEVMKKHYKAYVNGFDGAKELRIKLMEAKDYDEVEKIVTEQYPVLTKERNLV